MTPHDDTLPEAGGELGHDPTLAAYERAEHFNDIGRHDLARDTLHRALAQDPESALLHFELGRAELLADDLSAAERHAEEALRLDPNDSEQPYYLLGLIASQRGHHRRAERMFLDGLRIHPENPAALTAYGQLMQKTGHLEKAQRLAREALRLEPDLPEAHALLATVLSEQHDTTGAIAHGARRLQIDPDHEHSHLAMGIALLRSGRPFAARRHLREAMRIDPDPDAEQLFLQADRCTRWVYLPMYYWSLACDRLPGKQFAIWGVVIGFSLFGPAFGVPELTARSVLLCYLAFVIYTWFADPLAALWIKLRPPR